MFEKKPESISSPPPTPRHDSVATEIQSLRDEIALLHSLTRSLYSQNVALRNEHEEMMEALRSIQESISQLTVGTASRSPIEHDVASTQPDFDPRSRTFYTVIKGRCPGIYSNLYVIAFTFLVIMFLINPPPISDWTRFLIDNLTHVESQWKSYPSYAESLQAFMTGLARDAVEVTGRVQGDEHRYGPRTYFIPYPSVEEYNAHLLALRRGN